MQGFRLLPCQVEFDNDSDPDATIITISGRDKADLLMALTGSFNALELRVVSANILSRDDGRVLDNFRVTDMHDAKARPSAQPCPLIAGCCIQSHGPRLRVFHAQRTTKGTLSCHPCGAWRMCGTHDLCCPFLRAVRQYAE